MTGNRVGVILVLILELASPGGFIKPWSLGGWCLKEFAVQINKVR